MGASGAFSLSDILDNPSRFNTPLDAPQEKLFQAWKQKYAPRDSGEDYDLRGAFKAGLTPDPQTGHWPDTFKKPNHPTFSNESQYARFAPNRAGTWNGDTYVPPQPMGLLSPPSRGAFTVNDIDGGETPAGREFWGGVYDKSIGSWKETGKALLHDPLGTLAKIGLHQLPGLLPHTVDAMDEFMRTHQLDRAAVSGLFSPATLDMYDKMKAGHTAEAVGNMVGTYGPLLLGFGGSRVPAIQEGAAITGTALKGAVKGALETRPSLVRAGLPALASEALGHGFLPGAALETGVEAGVNAWKGARQALRDRRLPPSTVSEWTPEQVAEYNAAQPEAQARIALWKQRTKTNSPGFYDPQTGKPLFDPHAVDPQIVAAARQMMPDTAMAMPQSVAATPLPPAMSELSARLAGNPVAATAARELAESLVPSTIKTTPSAPPPRGTIPQARFTRATNADIGAKFLNSNKALFGDLDVGKLAHDSPVWDQLQQLADTGQVPELAGLKVPATKEARIKLRDAIAAKLGEN